MKPEKRKIIWNFILNKGCQLITKLLTDARHSEEKMYMPTFVQKSKENLNVLTKI